MKLLGHLALTRYPVPPRTESAVPRDHLHAPQPNWWCEYFERQELDVEGFQWAGVFKPVADVDDSFALAEPPAHDDWVPQAVQDKGRRTEVRVALTRIREAADKYLSPRKPSVASSECLPSAAHVGDMLADLLSGLEGPAPSTRVAPSGPVSTSSWASAGTGCTRDMRLAEPLLSALLGPSPPGYRARSHRTCFHRARRAPRPVLTASAGRRVGRPRVNVVGTSHAPAQSPGWTRTTMDVQLVNGSPAAPAVDVSVRVGYDGGSMEDTEVIRIIGWLEWVGRHICSRPD